jgi:hypothetical protein
MKRLLIIYFSQSGQLGQVVDSISAPLASADDIEVVIKTIKPVKDYPFPWPFMQFFNTFPETVYADSQPVQPISIDENSDFDLVILAYQVWFLSPSLPTTAFLQSEQAKNLLKDKPVITVIACRNMWLTAQEKMKATLHKLHAHLLDNVVFIDDTHSAFTFISTPLWVLTGKKGPFLAGIVPKAGLTEQTIAAAARFGRAIAAQLPDRNTQDSEPMLKGLNAVAVNENWIASEKIAHRSFRIWGGLLRFIGKPESLLRKIVLIFYIIFLVTLILTVVPLSAIVKKIVSPLTKTKIKQQRHYYAGPSGESAERMEQFK